MLILLLLTYQQAVGWFPNTIRGESVLFYWVLGFISSLFYFMEGLPLAIELTAIRSAHLSPELVLARLEHRLDVARSGPRDLPYHQRTLRAAIGWSYDLLDEPERLLFQRMSVFVGGATFDALEAICNAHEDIEGSLQGEGGLAGALEGLLQQSLVYRVTMRYPTPSARDTPRQTRWASSTTAAMWTGWKWGALSTCARSASPTASWS